MTVRSFTKGNPFHGHLADLAVGLTCDRSKLILGQNYNAPGFGLCRNVVDIERVNFAERHSQEMARYARTHRLNLTSLSCMCLDGIGFFYVSLD